MKRDELLEVMRRGFDPIERYMEAHPLNEESTSVVTNLTTGISHYRDYMRLTGGLFESPRPKLEVRDRCKRFTARGTKTAERDGGFYLDDKERARFEAEGYLGPYRVVSPEEAHDLNDFVRALQARNFDDHVFSTKEIEQALRRQNLWSLDVSGWCQAQHHKELWDCLARPEIVHRMASLLGDDLLCWRSQFFEKPPGSAGTFWHQTDTFREMANRPKLVPTIEANRDMIQLTAWIALTDATIKNGCVRIVPGSFSDSRLESFTYFVADNVLPFLVEHDDAGVERILAILLYAPIFEKQQVLFDIAMQHFPDLFDGFEVRDIEMKAGEFFLFHSMNVHASYPNVSDGARLAMVGRYTTNDVKVLPGFTSDVTPTPEGNREYSIEGMGCIQVHGTDRYGWNNILPYRW